MKTHYQILGVDSHAGPEVIEAAWKTLARLYHPDNGRLANADKCAAVNNAHDVLKDRVKRKEYDALLKAERTKAKQDRKAPVQDPRVSPNAPNIQMPQFVVPDLAPVVNEVIAAGINGVYRRLDPSLQLLIKNVVGGSS